MGILLRALLVFQFTSAAAGVDPAGQVDDLVSRVIRAEDPGAAVLVLKEGKPVYQKAFGLADLDKRIPVALTTRFELASGSKQFTAFAIMLLLDRKLVSLTDDVRKHFPELPEWNTERPIRIVDLLHHTSGIPDHVGNGMDKRITDADYLGRTAKRSLEFRTGTTFKYSNMGYRLLAILVQRVTRKSLGEFLKEEVFVPAGMTRTLVRENLDEEIPDRARGYGRARPYRLMENVDLVLHGEAGVWTSIEDLVKWDEVLRKPRFVRPETLAQAWAAGALDNGTPLPYGFGWFVERDEFGRKIHHGGDFPGFAMMHLRYPDRELSVMVLRNLYGGFAKDLASRIAAIFLDNGEKRQIPRVLAPEEQQRLVGSYRSMEGASRTIATVMVVKDQLQLDVPGQLPYILLPVTVTRFRLEFAPQGYFADFTVEKGVVEKLVIEHGKDRPSATLLRVPDRAGPPSKPEPGDLQSYVGTYSIPDLAVSVALVNGVLTLRVPDQTPYSLTALTKTRFKLEGAPEGYVAEFDSRAVTIEHGNDKPPVTLRRKE